MVKKPPFMLSSRGNGLITFWNTRNIEEVYTFQGTPAGENVLCMCLSDSNDTLIVGDYRGYVTVYDITAITEHMPTITRDNIRLIKRFKAHTKLVSTVSYISKYNLILSASYDNTVILFDCYGVMVGFFGQTKQWQLGKPITYGTQSLKDLKQSIGLEADLYDDNLSSDEEAEAEKEAQRVARQKKFTAEKRKRKFERLRQQGLTDQVPEEDFEETVACEESSDESTDEEEEDSFRLPKIPVPDQAIPKIHELEDLALPEILESPRSKKTTERRKKKNSTTSRFEKVNEQEQQLQETLKYELLQANRSIEMLAGNHVEQIDLEESLKQRTKTSDHFPERFREYNTKVMKTKIANQDWLDRVNSLIDIEDLSNVRPDVELLKRKDRAQSRSRRDNGSNDTYSDKTNEKRLGTGINKQGIDDIKAEQARLNSNIDNFLALLKTQTAIGRKKHTM
jgi:hypothetical protein